MKKSYQLLSLLLALLVFSTKSFSQNNLAAGDLAIVSYQSDFDASNPVVGDNNLAEFEDRFSIAVLKPGGLAAGTVIFFTSRGWNGPANNWHDEDYPPFTFGVGRRAVVQWTVPAGGIAAGTEVFFINKYHDEVAVGSEYYDWGAYSDYNGTTALGVMANVTPIVPAANSTDGMGFSFSGDHLLVYQTGPVAGPTGGFNGTPIRFITALLANNNGTTTNFTTWDATPGAMASAESSVPPGLVNGQTCFLMSPGPLPGASNGVTEPDNGKFSACALSAAGSCTALQLSTIIYNNANWTYSNSVFPLGTASSLCTYTILPINTITLTSGAGSNVQTRCINTAITNITYSTTGATGATFSGLPAGVTGNWAANVVTISGSPTTTVGSPFSYTVTLTGGCGAITATGTITVTPNNTITLTSAAGTNAQTVCINTAITNITYSTTGATGATFSGLPAGVTGNWAANVVTISGSPTTTVGSPFSYTVTLTGGCGTITATGTITVNGVNSITLTSGAGTNVQSVLVNTPITNITYSTTSATGATFSGLPPGVTGNWAANVVTISGSPTTAVASPYNYTVTLTGGCGTATATGTITVTTCTAVNQTVTASPTSVCTGTASTITVGASQPGVNYTLRIDPANTIVAGPTASNGPAINFSTGPIAAATTYNVLAETDKYSLNLNGGQNGFKIPQVAALDLTNNFTIEGWIKPAGNGAFARLFDKDLSYALGLSANQTQLTFTRHFGAPGDFSRPFTFVNGTWYHIACTYASGTIELFVNGVSIGTVGGVPAINIQTGGADIGSENGGFNRFNGNIDNVRLWNSVRTQAQLSANQTAFLTSTGNPTLVASWWMIEGAGNAKDYSANAINATALDGIWQVDAPVAPCSIVLTTKPTVSIAPNNTITLTSAAGTNAQTVCINTAITNITYSTTGATGATFSGLPAGVTGNWAANVVTISGSPTTTVGSPFSYTVTLTGGCAAVITATGTITVTPNNTITLTSAAGTNAQTVCINTAITNITYSTTGATGATFSGLPAGVTGNWAANVVTISGTPTTTVGSPFSYTVTLTGGCGVVTATGTITVTPNNTITLTSAAGTNAQTVCINTAITNITYSTTGATGATFSGLPAGVTGNWAANVVTISGSPTTTVGSPFSYTVTLTGGCGVVTATGTITVTPNNTITLTSAAGTNAQTVCINTAITNITYSTTGATGATFSGLPAGVTGNWAANVVTISGTPTTTVGSPFSYTVTLTGGCGVITATGTITVTPNNTITLTSAAGTNAQTVCINTAITNITYSTTGATGATFSGLPAGVTGNWAANVVTISGSPTTTVGSPFSYTVTLTGGCGVVTATGTITVTPNNTITLTSAAGTNAQTVCINTAITNITYSTTGATGATFSGLPAGVTGNWAANVVTISGTPTTTVGSPFSYTVTLTGGCGVITATGTITVNPTPTVNAVANQVVCNNAATTAVSFGGTPPGVVFNWTNNDPSIGLAASGTGDIASFTATNTTNAPVVATITVTPSTNSGVTCTGTATTFTITVNPTATVDLVANQIVCNGAATTAVNFTSPTTGGTIVYNWTNSDPTIGLGASGTGNIASFNGINTTNAPVTATITVTPSYTNASVTCAGTPSTFTITVNPTPDVAQPANQVICNNAATLPVSFTSTVTGTIFNWTNNDPSIGLAASGTGDIASFTATNATNAPVVATVTVTPSTDGGAGGGLIPEVLYYKFDGTGTSVPNLASAPPVGTTTATLMGGITQGGVAICDGTSIGTGASSSADYVNTGWAPNLGTSSWTISFKSENIGPSATLYYVFGDINTNTFRCFTNGVAGPNNWILRGAGLTDITLSGGATTAPHTNTFVYDAPLNEVRAYLDGVLVSTVAQGVVNLTGTGPFKVNGYSTNVGSPLNGHYDEFRLFSHVLTPAEILSLNGCPSAAPTCTGAPKTFTYTVNPTPVVTPVTNQAVCNGAPTTAVNFTSPTTGGTIVYNWTNNDPSIGLAASGSGNIASFTAINTGSAPVTATITVTPSYTNASVTCTGAAITFNIIVNPSGQVDQPVNQLVCNGDATAPVTFTTTVPGTIFNWTNNNTSVGLGASGTGNIPSFTGTNATNAPNVATITVTPSYIPVSVASQTFNYTGAMQTFVVPAGVTSVTVNSYGAQGGTGSAGSVTGGAGGMGSRATGTLAVTPGQVLNIFVGGAGTTGTGGFNGGGNGGNQNSGGGGGASDVRYPGTTIADRIIVGAGGGGGGRGGCESGVAGTGGDGGTGDGNGVNGGDSPTSGGAAGGGFGAIGSNFGGAGIGCGGFLGAPGINGNASGSGGDGGAGQSCCCFSFGSIPGGGGGGGGFVGGGGAGGGSAGTAGCSGNDKGAGGGGAGGSSNTGALTAPAITAGVQSGDGQVVINWNLAVGAACAGPAKTFTITVNPTAQVNQPANQVVCNNTATAATVFTTTNTGGTVTYAWTNNNTTIGLGASGTGNIPSFTGTNATNAPNVATITVTPSYTNGAVTCVGPSKTFTYTVNPTATVNPVANQVLCNGANSTPVNFSSPTTGGTIVYNWTNSLPSIGLAASGTGNIPTFVAVNLSPVPVVATITVTPTYTNGAVSCAGTPISFTITVNPPPLVNQVANQVVCNNSPTANVNFTTPVSGGAIVFNWTNNTPSIGLAAAGTGDILSFTALNATNAPVVATITVIMSYTNGGITCVSLPMIFTITVNPTPDVNQPADQALCAGATTTPVVFSGTVPGTVFNWTNNNTSIGLAASGTGNIAGFTAINATNVPQVATITVTPSYTNAGTTCTGPFKTFTITVNPTPTVAPVTNKAYCTGATTAVIPFNGTVGGTVAGTVFNWTNSNPAIGLAASGTGDIAAFVTTNATNGPLVATITVTPVGPTGCVGTAISFTITVNPTPIVNAVASQTVCNGSATAVINFTSPTTGPTGALSFNWTNNTTSIGLAATGTGNIASFIAVNTGITPVVATITVTPVYTNAGITCTGAPVTFTITVNPTPTVNAVANQVLCNGSNTAAVTFTGTVAGTIYNWTNTNTSIGLAASGTGNIASFVATNATNVPQVATITVTPSYTNGVTCPGTPITFTITVNPIPVVNAVANQVVCAGSTVTQVFSGPVAGTVFNWTNSNTAIGLAASGTGNLSFTATNTTGGPLTGTITVTPSYTNGGVTCTGSSITFTITVNPVPTVNAVLPQVLCNGSGTTAITFSGAVAGTVYSWTNTNTTIGLAASGTGNIASFVATNATAVVQTATITVTPSYTNGGTTCTGTPITFTITVNPTPSVTAIANQTVCAGAATTAITITGPVAATVYSWTNNNTSIGLGASGTNTIPSFTAINTGSTPVTATIIVTPTFTNGGISCSGASISFTITVNPTANVSVPANQTLCNGSTTAAVIFTGTVAGTTYSWTNSNTSIGLAASGTGNIAAFTATNTTAVVQTATITVTASAAGCAGTPVTFTITVNPTASVTAIANQTVCAGSSTTAVTITGPVAGTVYSWTNNNTSIGLGASGTGTIPSFVTVNPTTSAITATITISSVSAAGCVGTGTTFTITVNPQANVIFTNLPPRVCLTDTLVNLANKVSPAGGTWSGNGVSGGIFSAVAAGVGVHTLTYTVTNGSGCTAVRYFSVTVNDCKERHNVFSYAIRLWPNPNSGRFSIQFNSDKYKEFKVKIVNARGQEVGYYEFKNLVYGQIIPFDLYKLAGGQYFLYVYNTQESGVFPFVIAR